MKKDNKRDDRNFKGPKVVSEFEEKIIEIKRVSKKIKGGNAIGFTVLVVVGNRGGKVGYGYGKAKNVADAIGKAVAAAKNKMYEIKIKNGKTISHEVTAKVGAAKIFLKPAPEGTGIIAGGSVRIVVDLAGIKDISSKVLGSNNKLLNVRCTLAALGQLKN